MTSNRYRIIQTTSGVELGVYEGETPEDAIRAMLADAGAADQEADAGLVAELVTAKHERTNETKSLMHTLRLQMSRGASDLKLFAGRALKNAAEGRVRDVNASLLRMEEILQGISAAEERLAQLIDGLEG